MKQALILVWMAFLGLVPPLAVQAKVAEPKVVFVVIDGVRDIELQGKGRDAQGKTISAATLFPNLLALKKRGVFLSEMRISNPAGVSLPAYSDIFAGHRQEKIINNRPEELQSGHPTIFQVLKKELKLGFDGVALHSAWEPICAVAVTPDGDKDFYRSCGWKKGFHEGEYFKPEIYTGTRTDMDTFVEFARETPKRHPRFAFVHLADADEEAHFHENILEKTGVDYGIFHYHNALRADDYFLGRIWSMLQADPFYRDSTYLVVTTDHGRDNFPDLSHWYAHGDCVKKHSAEELCSGCSHVFALIVGPGLKPRTLKTPYTHLDLAPTAAKLMGVAMPTATGKPIPEIVR